MGASLLALAKSIYYLTLGFWDGIFKMVFDLGIWILDLTLGFLEFDLGNFQVVISFKAMLFYTSMPMCRDMRNNANQQVARDSSIAGLERKEANCHNSKQLVIDGCVYQIHPIYDLYAAPRDDQIIHIIRQVPNAGNKNNNGYMRCIVRKYGDKNKKTYYVHRFTWECYNGIIPDDKVIDHINDKTKG